jgi:hypothetical protein
MTENFTAKELNSLEATTKDKNLLSALSTLLLRTKS